MLDIFSSWDFRKGQLQFLVTFSAPFFLVSKLYNSGLQFISPISDHLKFMASVDIEDL